MKTSHVTIQVRKIRCENSNKKQLNDSHIYPACTRARQSKAIDFDVNNNHDLLKGGGGGSGGHILPLKAGLSP